MAEATKGLILGSTLLPFIKISRCGFKSSRGFELGQRFEVLPFIWEHPRGPEIADSPKSLDHRPRCIQVQRGWNAP